jgi:peptide/nickel transport system permease protein
VKFLLKRLGFYGLAAFFAVTLNFLLPRLMPGDAASAMFARFQGRLSPEALAALKRAIGISDGPLVAQYFQYLRDLLHGNLGTSVSQYPATVAEVVWTGLGWTVLVAGSSLVIGFVLGTALGVLAGWRRGGVIDSVLPPALAFIGAHAISQARLFNAHGTGRELAPQRLEVLAGRGGVNDCGNAQNCVKVCPKKIPLTESIAAIGRAVTIHKIKQFFGA